MKENLIKPRKLIMENCATRFDQLISLSDNANRIQAINDSIKFKDDHAYNKCDNPSLKQKFLNRTLTEAEYGSLLIQDKGQIEAEKKDEEITLYFSPEKVMNYCEANPSSTREFHIALQTDERKKTFAIELAYQRLLFFTKENNVFIEQKIIASEKNQNMPQTVTFSTYDALELAKFLVPFPLKDPVKGDIFSSIATAEETKTIKEKRELVQKGKVLIKENRKKINSMLADKKEIRFKAYWGEEGVIRGFSQTGNTEEYALVTYNNGRKGEIKLNALVIID